MLTAEEKKRLAVSIRGLALDCAAGTAPRFGDYFFFMAGKPCCFIGHAASRSGLDSNVLMESGDFPRAEYFAVLDANDGAPTPSERASRLVFPGLALADALESL